jgi:hypothetical protein
MTEPNNWRHQAQILERRYNELSSQVATAKQATLINNDLAIGYRAGQGDSVAWKHLVEIVRLEAIAGETGDSDDFDALWDAIQMAREVLAKRKAGA